MKEKKNIDRLFQEKFKNFEAQPGDHIWENIAAAQRPTQKKAIPIWWKLGAAAAILILALLAGNLWMTQTNESPKLVQEETKPVQKEDSLYSNSRDIIVDNTNLKDDTTNAISEKHTTVEQPVSEEESSKVRTKNSSKRNATLLVENSNSERTKSDESLPKNRKTSTDAAQSRVPVVSATTNLDAESSEEKAHTNLKNSETIAANESQQNGDSDNTEQAYDSEELEQIAASKEEQAVADATIENENTQSSKRWGLTPMIAPVYYGDFGGSGIDAQFSDNSKSGGINMSYGLQISYAVSKRLTLRSGVNKVDLSYRTNDVGFAPGVSVGAISSISYKTDSEVIQIASTSKSGLPASPGGQSTSEFSSASNLANSNFDSSLNQTLGYIEVPLEAAYSLFDAKIGVQLVGGVSTLFLNNNAIILDQGSNLSSELGVSNSLNKTSFSTNIGLGLDYKVTDLIQFNLEPMFKYQLNAYTNTVSNFKPYYLGLYTGVSIKF